MQFSVLAAAAVLSLSAAVQAGVPTASTATCSTFLKSLDANPAVTSCLSPLIKASKAGTTDTTNLCASACADSLVWGVLQDFSSSCPEDLASSAQIAKIYDSLYVANPMVKAICSVDPNSGVSCPAALASGKNLAYLGETDAAAAANSTGSADSTYAAIKDTAKNALKILNAGGLTKRATLADSLLPFLYITPDLPPTTLCTACVRSTIAPFLQQEMQVPYAAGTEGVAGSPLLSKQSDLWSAIGQKCGASFQASIAAVAGTPQGSISAAGMLKSTPLSVVLTLSTLVAAVLLF